MPSLIKKRGKDRYRASVMVKGKTKAKLFPDSKKQSFREAVIWETETKEKPDKGAISDKFGLFNGD